MRGWGKRERNLHRVRMRVLPKADREKGKVFYRTASPPRCHLRRSPPSPRPAQRSPPAPAPAPLPPHAPPAAAGGDAASTEPRQPGGGMRGGEGGGPALLRWLHFARRFCSPPLPAPPPPLQPRHRPAAPRPARGQPGPAAPALPAAGEQKRGASSGGRRVLRPRRCGAGGGEAGGRGGRRRERGGGRGTAGTRRGAGPQPRPPSARPGAHGAGQRRPQPRRGGLALRGRSARRIHGRPAAVGASPGATPPPPAAHAGPGRARPRAAGAAGTHTQRSPLLLPHPARRAPAVHHRPEFTRFVVT